VPEGNLTSCGIDYLERDWNPRSYLIFYSIFVYYIPLFLICYSYWFIIAVSGDEKRIFQSLNPIYPPSGCLRPREGHARAGQEDECQVPPLL